MGNISQLETKESGNKLNKKLKNILKSTVFGLVLLLSQPSDAGGWFNFKMHYNTDYYDKYNSNIPTIEEVERLLPKVAFFVEKGQLKAGNIRYSLSFVKDIELNEKELKEYDLKTVIVNINGRNYKAKPHFKKLVFTKHGKKGVFGYTVRKEIILVYVLYQDKIKVIGTISQGQFIEENDYKEYNIGVEKEIKKQVLKKIFAMLSCNNLKQCFVKSDRYGDNYFYKNGKLIGVLKNFGSDKILIKKMKNGWRKIATIQTYKNKILMVNNNGDLIYSSNGQINVKIDLTTLGYKLDLSVSN